jgi:hypothetical protein
MVCLLSDFLHEVPDCQAWESFSHIEDRVDHVFHKSNVALISPYFENSYHKSKLDIYLPRLHPDFQFRRKYADSFYKTTS